MKIKLNYIIIPAVVISVALSGSYFTSAGLNGWYEELVKPHWTPAGSFIGAVWTFLYVLLTAVVLVFYNSYRETKKFTATMAVFGVNALLNALWPAVFFSLKLPGAAFLHITVLLLSIGVLVFLIWPVSKLLALGLAPYGVWVIVAGVLNYRIWVLN